jgi:hypothetical protein
MPGFFISRQRGPGRAERDKRSGLRPWQEALDIVAKAATQPQASAIQQHHNELAVCLREQLANSSDIHNRRAVDPDKVVRGKARGEASDCVADEMCLAPRVQADVIPVRFDPIDLHHIEQQYAAAIARSDTDWFSRSRDALS